MKKVIEKCVKSFNINIDQMEMTEPIKKIMEGFSS